MMTSLVLTVIGTDRPGLVGRLARIVADHGGNWLESRMAHLGGQFAGILHVEVANAGFEALWNALQALEDEGLRLVMESSAEPSAVTDPIEARLDLVGHDRPGIVAEIAGVLADHGVNVEEWNTQTIAAPMSGEPLFQAHGRVRIPRSADLAELREDLETISHDLMVEVTLVVEEGRDASGSNLSAP